MSCIVWRCLQGPVAQQEVGWQAKAHGSRPSFSCPEGSQKDTQGKEILGVAGGPRSQ